MLTQQFDKLFVDSLVFSTHYDLTMFSIIKMQAFRDLVAHTHIQKEVSELLIDQLRVILLLPFHSLNLLRVTANMRTFRILGFPFCHGS